MTPNKIILSNKNKKVIIDIRALNETEVYYMYPEIFKHIFGYFEKCHIPEIVDVAEYKNSIIGFASGRLYNKDTWYAQFGGVYDKYRSIGLAEKLWKTHFKRIENLYDIKYITLRTENTNIPAFYMNIKTGFIPVGMSVSNGKMYIQWNKKVGI